ncbi:MAG: sugar phosphate isomerase/epimerase family protein [Bryobacteraceae bacterium]
MLRLIMSPSDRISRRSILSLPAAATLAFAAKRGKRIPIGLELFSVRKALQQDLMGTVRSVAEMGYQCVEFFAPYYAWTPDYAKQVKKLLDDTGIKCYSTHNGGKSFSADGMAHAIELNQILGARFIVWASAGKVESIDGWKKVAETLTGAADKLRPLGLRTGYHNHELEFLPIEGKRPIEVIAANTPKDVMLQLDVGTCIQAGSDPVAWINQNPGRILAMHCKDWSPDKDKGYRVLFGEGVAPWKKIFAAAEKTGGVEYYLIEQEGSAYPELETAKRCLTNYRKLRA